MIGNHILAGGTKEEDRNMGRALNADMIEGNAARQMPGKYGEPVYDRRERDRSGNGRREPAYDGGGRTGSGGRAAWKEPIYEGRRERSGGRAAWKEPIYEGRRERSDGRAAWKEPIYEGRRERSGGHVAWKEPIYEGRREKSGGRAAWKEPVSDSRGRTAGNGRKKSGRQKRKKMQHKILGGLLCYFILAGIIATCWAIISLFFGRGEKVHAEDAQQISGEMPQEGIFSEGEEAGGGASVLEITPEIRQECQDLFARQENLLILVNKEHELSASYSPGLRSICKGRLEAADVLYEDLCAMLEAGSQAGYQYWIASAHRDRAYQQNLVDEDVHNYMAKGYSYEAALQKTYEYTMPAGQSEHETGLALDILCSTNTIMDESQKSEPGNQWLVQHCHEYGFILRYPEDKVDITGISYEPWHFRYVGREAAAYLTEKGWTLEEYYEAL